jgi:hypothetical protein
MKRHRGWGGWGYLWAVAVSYAEYEIRGQHAGGRRPLTACINWHTELCGIATHVTLSASIITADGEYKSALSGSIDMPFSGSGQ